MRALSFAFASLMLSAPAFAADLGTYRPGTPYHSTAVPAADVCESTCAGDANCRGWNYVKAAPQAPGICELQSTIGAPVASAISISGVNNGQTPSARNVVQGGTNTIRVGTASTATAQPQSQRNLVPSGRRVVRQAPPQIRQAQPSAYRQPTAQVGVPGQIAPRQIAPRQIAPRQTAPRQAAPSPVASGQPRAAHPQFQPMLDSRMAPPARGHVAGQPQGQYLAQARGPARQRGGMATRPNTQIQPSMTQSQFMQQQMLQQQMRQQQMQQSAAPQQGRPPIGQPIPPAPKASAASAASVTPPAQSMPTRSASQPLTMQQAQTSLYGSLHDDVRVPAANMPVPSDPNAPIPTAQSRPVAPVAVEPLAGAMPR